VTLQVPEARVQLVALKTPVEPVVKLTEPVGVPTLEVTVAAHVVAVLSGTLAGEQETVVVVELTATPTATVKLPLLPECTLSPP
jgi:hypothetical protein